MNHHEVKFVLGAYRPDDRDAGDPAFVEALAHAKRDPGLRTWLEREKKFDTAIAGKLAGIAPPAGLRDAILAGARVSRPRRSWWAQPRWLAAAAALALVAALGITAGLTRSGPKVAELAALALGDLIDAHDEHAGYPPDLQQMQARLGSSERPLASLLSSELDLDELRRKNCRSVRIAGIEVFELCFFRDGAWFHLYAARRSDFGAAPVDMDSALTSRGDLVATAWADAKHVYALVADNPAALRRVI